MRKKRLVIVSLLSCLGLVGASFGLTYAFLFADTAKPNVFTVGKNEVEIEEDFEPPTDLEKCTGFKKVVQIKNTGNISCYVRVRVDFSDSDALAFCTPDYDSDAIFSKGEPWYYCEADGYYYYKDALPPFKKDEVNGITSPLFKWVDVEENAAKINFDIMVYSESCEAGDYSGFWQAWGLDASGEEAG